MMGHVFAVVNQKGGTGKTTTAVNVAASLGELGKNVLLVDLDPQGNATSGMGIEKSGLGGAAPNVHKSTYDVLINGAPASAAITATRVPGVSIVPASE